VEGSVRCGAVPGHVPPSAPVSTLDPSRKCLPHESRINAPSPAMPPPGPRSSPGTSAPKLISPNAASAAPRSPANPPMPRAVGTLCLPHSRGALRTACTRVRHGASIMRRRPCRRGLRGAVYGTIWMRSRKRSRSTTARPWRYPGAASLCATAAADRPEPFPCGRPAHTSDFAGFCADANGLADAPQR